MHHIRIGEAETNSVDDWKVEPDDRQTMIQVEGGVVLQDRGRFEQGDKITCTCRMWQTEFQKVREYWEKREKIAMVDEAGSIHENMRVRVISWGYFKDFPETISCELEFWRI